MRIRTVNNIKLSDDSFVEECVDNLKKKWPQITGHMFERLDEDHINLLLWGDFHLTK